MYNRQTDSLDDLCRASDALIGSVVRFLRWLANSKQGSICFIDTRHLFRDGSLTSWRHQKSRHSSVQAFYLDCLSRCVQDPKNIKTTSIECSKKARVIKIARSLQWSEGQSDQDLYIIQSDLVDIWIAHIEHLQMTYDSVKISTRSPPSQTRSSLA